MNERIKILRKDLLNLTLEKFGERLGVSRAAMSNIENGNRNVTDQMFKSICREFNVNESWLRNGIGDPFSIPEDETAALVFDLLENPTDEFYQIILKLIHTYKLLDPDLQKVIRDFCQNAFDQKK